MMLVLLLATAAAAASPDPVTTSIDVCKSDNQADILVCGKPSDRFRIDPNVLEASRQANASPPKPPADATAATGNACVGPDSCKGGVIPLVGMALVAAKVAELAATGGDWRDAIRTHDDEYRLYKQAEERRRKARRPRIGLAVAN